MGELVGFATGHPMLALAVLLIIAVCQVLREWILHRTTIRHEAEATQRVRLAVGDTSSTERAAVVRACADLEAASHPGPRLRRSRTVTPTEPFRGPLGDRCDGLRRTRHTRH